MVPSTNPETVEISIETPSSKKESVCLKYRNLGNELKYLVLWDKIDQKKVRNP